MGCAFGVRFLRLSFGLRVRKTILAEWFESSPLPPLSPSEPKPKVCKSPSLSCSLLRERAERSPILGESPSVALPIKRFEIGGRVHRVGYVSIRVQLSRHVVDRDRNNVVRIYALQPSLALPALDVVTRQTRDIAIGLSRPNMTPIKNC